MNTETTQAYAEMLEDAETRRERLWRRVLVERKRYQNVMARHKEAMADLHYIRAQYRELKENEETKSPERLWCPRCERTGPLRPTICWYCNADLEEIGEIQL